MLAVLQRGDTLYMPPGWYHAVQQREETAPEWRPCVAVNFWYDRDIGDEAREWSTQALIGRLSRRLHGIE